MRELRYVGEGKKEEKRKRKKRTRSRYEKHAKRNERRERERLIGNCGEKRTAGESRVDCKSNRCRRLASKQAALATPHLSSSRVSLSFPLLSFPTASNSLSLSLSLPLPSLSSSFLSFYLSLFTLVTTLEQIPAR